MLLEKKRTRGNEQEEGSVTPPRRQRRRVKTSETNRAELIFESDINPLGDLASWYFQLLVRINVQFAQKLL